MFREYYTGRYSELKIYRKSVKVVCLSARARAQQIVAIQNAMHGALDRLKASVEKCRLTCTICYRVLDFFAYNHCNDFILEYLKSFCTSRRLEAVPRSILKTSTSGRDIVHLDLWRHDSDECPRAGYPAGRPFKVAS
jgi:hypothetical protein